MRLPKISPLLKGHLFVGVEMWHNLRQDDLTVRNVPEKNSSKSILQKNRFFVRWTE